MKKVLLWIGVGLFSIVAGVSSCALLIDLLTVEEEVTAADMELLLTDEDLLGWFEDWEPDTSAAETKRVRYPDGSRELSYFNDTTADGGPYLDVTVNWEASVTDAKSVMAAMWVGLRVGVHAVGDRMEEVAPPPDLGDECRMALVYDDDVEDEFDGAYGTLVAVREGTAVYFVILDWFILDQPADWEVLLAPKIRLLAAR